MEPDDHGRLSPATARFSPLHAHSRDDTLHARPVAFDTEPSRGTDRLQQLSPLLVLRGLNKHIFARKRDRTDLVASRKAHVLAGSLLLEAFKKLAQGGLNVLLRGAVAIQRHSGVRRFNENGPWIQVSPCSAHVTCDDVTKIVLLSTRQLCRHKFTELAREGSRCMWAQHNDVDAGRDIFKGVAGPLPLPVHQVVERKLAASENPQQLGLRH